MKLDVPEALQLADEIAQIRALYGLDCAAFVEAALRQSRSDDWRAVVSGAISAWERHRRKHSYACL